MYRIEFTDILKSLIFRATVYSVDNKLLYSIVDTTPLLAKSLSATQYKGMRPFELDVRNKNGIVQYKIQQKVALFAHKIHVYDSEDELIGHVVKSVLPLSNKFFIEDDNATVIAEMIVDNEGNSIQIVNGNHTYLKATNEVFSILQDMIYSGYRFETSPKKMENNLLILLFASIISYVYLR